MTQPHIVMAGAGSIGCFVGGLLAAGGLKITLLARPSVIADIQKNGLTLTDFSGLSQTVTADQIGLSDDPACLRSADLILVTVKTGATAEMGRLIAGNSPATTPVISLQNGLAAIDALQNGLPDRDVRAGMVAFNVVSRGAGGYHRSTSGDILIGRGPRDLATALTGQHLTIAEVPDITAVQWGKLLINLNNALNALSGLTIHEQLLDPDWRRLMADQMAEALRVLRRAGIAEKSTAPVPSAWVPHILRLPTPLFRRVAAKMLTVDPTARTSMSDDLAQGRVTEVGALQGAIIELGQRNAVPTPIASGICDLIRAAEADGAGLPGLGPSEIRAALGG